MFLLLERILFCFRRWACSSVSDWSVSAVHTCHFVMCAVTPSFCRCTVGARRKQSSVGKSQPCEYNFPYNSSRLLQTYLFSVLCLWIFLLYDLKLKLLCFNLIQFNSIYLLADAEPKMLVSVQNLLLAIHVLSYERLTPNAMFMYWKWSFPGVTLCRPCVHTRWTSATLSWRWKSSITTNGLVWRLHLKKVCPSLPLSLYLCRHFFHDRNEIPCC